jgi:lipopolysaccharide transport system permease protein
LQSVSLKPLYQHRDLLIAWTSRTILSRYQQSILGGFWAILQPIAMVMIFTVIFTKFIHIDTGNVPYIVFSYVAMVPWTFFSTSISDMVESLVGNMNLVTKIYFPREILPFAAMLARLLDFGIASLVLVILMVAYRLPIFTSQWIFLPLILLLQMAFTLGFGMIAAALNVYLRDVKHLVALGLQLWLYATPIIYPVTSVPEKLRPYYFLNPMAGIIQSYRIVLLHEGTPDNYLLVSACISIFILLFGYWFFKRVEHQFADIV